MTIHQFRSQLYRFARLLGDLQAIQQGRIGKRIIRRVLGKLLGRLLRGI